MADVHLLCKHDDEFASQKMIDGLPECPVYNAARWWRKRVLEYGKDKQ